MANLLNYFVRSGRILPICRGVYAVVPPGERANSFAPNRYLVASVLRPGSILAYHSALEVLGHAHATSSVVYALSASPPRETVWHDHAFQYFGQPLKLQAGGHTELGVSSVDVADTGVRVTGPERTLADCLTHIERAGGVEEALVSLRGFPLFDFDLLEQYLSALHNPRVSAAVGAFLEQEAKRLFVPDEFLAQLERRRPGYRTYMERSQRGGIFLKRWNLIVPDIFLRREESFEV